MSVQSSRRATAGFATGVLSLRGLLAVTVATAHTLGFTISADYSASVLDQTNLPGAAAKVIGTAVNVPLIFFVISGLAIARSLDRKQQQGDGPRPYLIFIVRRVLRLYPAYIVATAGVLALAWLFLMGRPPLDPALYPSTGYDYIPDWLNGAVFNPLKARTVLGNFAGLSWSMNLVIWSLYVEVCAVPLLPLFHGAARRRNLAADAAILTALMAVTVVMWNTMLVRYWFAFYLGMLVQTRGRDCVRALIRRTGSAARLMAWAWLGIVLTCLAPTDCPANLLVQSVCAFVIVSLLVWRDDARQFRGLDRPWLQRNGRLSYSFYLWHYIILTVTVRLLYAALGPAAALHRVAMFGGTEIFTIAAALGLAQLSYSYVEEPFIRWGHRLETGARAAPAPLAAGIMPRQANPQGAD